MMETGMGLTQKGEIQRQRKKRGREWDRDRGGVKDK